MDETIKLWVIIAIALLLTAFGFVQAKRYRTRILKLDENDPAYETARKRLNRRRRILFMVGVMGLWLACGMAITLLFGPAHSERISVEMMPPRVDFLGINVSVTVLAMWVGMLALTLLAVILRLAVIPRFTENPRGIQNVLELMVEAADNYTKQKTGHLGQNLSAYIFSVAALLAACAMAELFGARAPTADIVMTFSLALVTYILINYYAIKKKGLRGRIKSLADPTPLLLPIRVLSDIAVPVSLASRLFGNMLGGMVVMELVYMALGHMAVGLPPLAGLYFNVFHPLIQIYIFITLSLTFIGEAVE